MGAKIFVLGYEMSGRGSVKFDVEVRREVVVDEATTYVPVGSAHRTVEIDAAAMAAVEAMDKTDGQKLQEVAALIRADVATWGAIESEDAANWFATICPELPVPVPLRL